MYRILTSVTEQCAETGTAGTQNRYLGGDQGAERDVCGRQMEWSATGKVGAGLIINNQTLDQKNIRNAARHD